ncbi:hypothetical protein MAR_034402 [Mya arenaria]|uniref:Uncharacterized protein n=1 Tax=Mya arenaria TaxID=6604 RepID=A0ABY7GCQ1_MYAAR|nr:uncharacterized protein LOC128224667 isoform X2 [Mya arenaria]WAR31860.1 hypothetical protein MAR_034402 [Mya arenaria]
MHTQVAGSVESTRSIERTKRCIRITAWATRILALLSIAFCIVSFAVVGEMVFGLCLMVTAILSVVSTLNFSCCCYSDCSRNTKTEQVMGHCGVYVWMFTSNIGYVIIFGYILLLWGRTGGRDYIYKDDFYYEKSSPYPSDYNSNTNDSMALLYTIFVFSLIDTFFLTMLNLYSVCLVYKYGCCFMHEIDRYHSEQGVETAVVMNQQITTVGGGLPGNFTNAAVGAQQTYTNPGVQYSKYQPYPGVSVQSTLAGTSGQSVSPPPYSEATPNVKQ